MSAIQQVQRWAWRIYHVDENSKSTDIGLLIIRVLFGVCLFYHHGGEKFWDFHTLASRPYLDPIGIGVIPSVVFAGFSDGVCSLLVLLGLFSRYASFFILVCLNTVWWLMNSGLNRLLGLPIPLPRGRAPQAVQIIHSLPNYLNVPMYILGFLVIFIAGPGRYSLDKLLEAKMRRKKAAVVAVSAD